MKKRRCYIYTRVSTSMQVEGYSLEAQKERLRKYADFQEMVIVGEYSDEGKSGKSIEGRQEFMQMGFTVVPFGQGYKDMSPPTKELMKLTLEERIAHGGHKVLRWMMDNVYVRQDPAGNIKMDKEKSTEKIDAAVATVMALDRAIRNQGSDGSVYDARGILVF